MVMGNYILLNMFLAIMLQNAQDDDDENEQQEKEIREADARDDDDDDVSSTSIQPQEADTRKDEGKTRQSSVIGLIFVMLGKMLGLQKANARENDDSYKRAQLERGVKRMKTLRATRKSEKQLVVSQRKMKFCLKSTLMKPWFNYLYGIIAVFLG